MIVPRTGTVIPLGDEKRDPTRDSRPLSEFRDAPAYVLLGDPGSGKTTAFNTECEAHGEEACNLDARDFIELSLKNHPEWHGKTLFIDGLDEVRAGVSNVREPFDKLRRRLENLGRPHFRLSCREADWLGDNDRERLEIISPGNVTVLRLDPLTEPDIVRILEDMGVKDPQAFMENARERRIDGLLQNPLTLELLTTVIARNEQWPESRLQTFEKACSILVREYNEEHEVASQPANTSQLLDAAGRLCAVQLISGKEGYTQGTGDQDSDFPSLCEIEYENPDTFESVLSTKLFKAESGSLNRFGPIHRHVAEYLGARYLARLIEGGLPASRVLSLITGEDGIVVTGLRGLSAWLAAHCKRARAELIERDPVGVGLYGDIRGFTLDEKEALLKTLNRETRRLGSIEIAEAFGPLAAPDMEPALRDVLGNRSRETEQQTFVDFILRFLSEGTPISGLSGLLLDIVRDESRWSGVNVSALKAFIHCEDDVKQTRDLKTLLKDIEDGNLHDLDNELLGILLTTLYPTELAPAEIWNYLFDTSGTNVVGIYRWFWEYDLLENSTDGQVAELLDSLNVRLADLGISVESGGPYQHFPVLLLARGLKVHGDKLDTKRLYDWLEAGLAGRHYSHEVVSEVRTWLEERPDRLKNVIVEGLKRCPETDAFRYHALKVRERLYGAVLPDDIGHWYLDQAVATANMCPQVAEHLLELAWLSHSQQIGNEGLSLKLLVQHARKNGLLMTRLDQLRGSGDRPRADRVEERERSQFQYIDQRKEQEEQWLDQLRSNETALRENRAAPALLTEIAARYFSDSINYSSVSGPRDIEQDLGREKNLIDAVRQGILGVVKREDIPDVEEILAVKEEGRFYYIGWPFMAAMAEIGNSAPEQISCLGEHRMRQALAFYFCLACSNRPNWYQQILELRPDLIADMVVRSATSDFRACRKHVSGLFVVAHDKKHAKVARHVSLPLLRAFPTRCNAEQIEALDHLLWAALRHADPTSFKKLIDRKLATKSMNVAQRVRWLAAAAVIAPEVYSTALVDFVQGQQRRVRNLAGFFPTVFPRAGFSLSDIELQIPVLEVLIRLIGSYYRPYEFQNERDDEWSTPAVNDSELVHAYIRRLAASPDKDASDALTRLLSDSALYRWRDVLSRARDSQRVIQRDASYRHPEPEQVCRTLDSGSPANAADLAALLVDRLDEIARQIQNGNTSDWRQYWENPSDKKVRKPKHEELCRDALLSDLKYKLYPLQIDAHPEGRYANDKRSDIRVNYDGVNVPVEIKKNNHPDLWNAIRSQLIAKYTRDPGAGGHGIYLVFWFGKEYTPSPPSGTRPDTPGELRERLEATLSDEEARRISVCVIDVSGK